MNAIESSLLLGEDEFIVGGDAQPIALASVDDDRFPTAREQFTHVDDRRQGDVRRVDMNISA